MVENVLPFLKYMGRIFQSFQCVGRNKVLYSLLCMALFGCSAQPMQKNLSDKREAQCEGIKISGTLTVSQFKNLFNCLNQTGTLSQLQPMMVGREAHAALFTRIYNETFGIHPQVRHKTFQLLKRLHDNGGLDDFLTFISELITEFIDTPDFDKHLEKLIEVVLSDNLDLLTPLQRVVTHPQTPVLSQLLKESFDIEKFGQLLLVLGTFLSSQDLKYKSGSENLTLTLQKLFTLPTSPHSLFTWEDLEELSVQKVIRNMLQEFYTCKQDGKLPRLVNFLSDLSHTQTTSILTEERLALLKEDPSHLLTDKERAASEKIILNHPASDLISLIKLISSLHRGFLEDEDPQRNQNLLISLDIFLQGVKSAFDENMALGPDAEATHVITLYSLYANIAYLELTFPEFHPKTIEQKKLIYPSGIYPHSDLYTKYQSDYAYQKIREDQAKYKAQLESEKRWTQKEIREKLHKRKDEFTRQELPTLKSSYQTLLDSHLHKVLTNLNIKKIFKDKDATIYDFLLQIKETKSLSLLFQKLLLPLDNKDLDRFIKEVIQDEVKDFFELNHPVDLFMRSLDKKHAGSTWLSHTIDPLIHEFGRGMPMKDQITLISIVESYQILERLLLNENYIRDFREIVFPLMKALYKKEDQHERLLRFIQSLHSGQFSDDYSEPMQPANLISPLLIQTIDSGLLMELFEWIAVFGKRADSTNMLLSFLLENNPDRPVTPFIETFRSLSMDHQKSFTIFLDHLAHFLIPVHVNRLVRFLRRYEQANLVLHPTLETKSFLTLFIKRDEMREFLEITQTMLKEKHFKRTHLFIKDLIHRGELKKAIHLLTLILLSQES